MISPGFTETIVELVRCVDRALVDLDGRAEPELRELAADLHGLRERMLRQLDDADGTTEV
jgi:hypothetical protein